MKKAGVPLWALFLVSGGTAAAGEVLLYGIVAERPADEDEEELPLSHEEAPQVVAVRPAGAQGAAAVPPRRLPALGNPYSMQPTPSGTALVTVAAPSGVPERLVEIDAAGRVLWSWDWPEGFCDISYTRAARVLADGDILISGYVGEPRPGGWEGGAVVRMTRAGKVVKRMRLEPFSHLGAVRLLDDETLLVAASEVYEVGWDGKRRRTWPLPKGKQYRDACPLPGGGLAVGAGQGTLSVVGAKGDPLWTVPHASVLSIQALPDGRLFVTG